jgi:hypothetical protein
VRWVEILQTEVLGLFITGSALSIRAPIDIILMVTFDSANEKIKRELKLMY